MLITAGLYWKEQETRPLRPPILAEFDIQISQTLQRSTGNKETTFRYFPYLVLISLSFNGWLFDTHFSLMWLKILMTPPLFICLNCIFLHQYDGIGSFNTQTNVDPCLFWVISLSSCTFLTYNGGKNSSVNSYCLAFLSRQTIFNALPFLQVIFVFIWALVYPPVQTITVIIASPDS